MVPVPVPLTLYVHVPWCVRKCPYCDFNSHALRDELPETRYVEALLTDLEQDLPRVWGRPVDSVFIGGGTPSLLSPQAIDRLLSGLRARLPLRPGVEITLEANPGTVEQARFTGFREAGVNRLSIGIQSFEPRHLMRLGRIHGRDEALAAVRAARATGFDNVNLDLMFGLPQQTPAEALADLKQALDLNPAHLSYYQLTLEPNTLFHRQPPPLPDEDTIALMQEQAVQHLAAASYTQYEVSAYARPGRQCRHNLNYWTFGDYLGIGAGAHGKLTDPADGGITRLWKEKHPRAYLERVEGGNAVGGEHRIQPRDLGFEFLLNALRLVEGVPADCFEQRTGLSLASLEPVLSQARQRGLMMADPDRLQATGLGLRFLNDLLEGFLQPG